MKTELTETLLERLGAPERIGGQEEVMKQLAERTLTGEIGAPEDTAEAYVYIMKDRFVTGSIIQTNGGVIIAPKGAPVRSR